MRKILLTATTVLALGSATALWPVHAQPVPDQDSGPPSAPMQGEWNHMPPGPMMGMHHHHVGELVAPAEDRKLTGADVQKIAEAYLLWNGNRSWKVTDVAETADNTISFSYSTPKGDLVARFKIDRKTGHIERVS